MEPQPMNGGDGPTSYSRNSSHQRAGVSAATAFIQDGIAEELELGVALHNNVYSTVRNSFAIADLGCSVGPNTFLAVEAILEAVRLKYGPALPQFHVFFNDQVGNDFNTLFRSLPPDAGYFAAGVAGSFHRRLFPKSSIHFVHSSYSIQWLSRVPKEVRDRENSASWNKGRIIYTGAPREVWTAYAAQYAEDLRSFLQARAEEVVFGGLMALLFPFSQSGNSSKDSPLSRLFTLLGSTLMDMAKKGHEVEEEKVDSFNLPIYIPSMTEFKGLVEENGYFSVVRTEALPPPVSSAAKEVFARAVSMSMRAGTEGMLSDHFGSQVVDDLFEKYEKKIVDSSGLLEINPTGEAAELFVLLKRKTLAIN
ncbi:hypothetical protein H6P81_009005 [Aristolochia fimbriata]|uniref:S-adenosylmethionine-dependent methyltransferase n=1 Tax=Aristolochia fimbriata TaxID=158543 RepID=A0AAV7EJK8_ARIFI|nr:hypothetical protein H6P81_009005 [Aristolochia fimbriata]